MSISIPSRPPASQEQPSDRYDVRLDPAALRVTVSVGHGNERRTRSLRIDHHSRSDKAMLAGALAQTCLALAETETQIQLLKEQLAVATQHLFGTSSEKKPRIPEVEDVLPTADDTAEAQSPVTAPNEQNVFPLNRRRGRKPLAAHLPRTGQEHRLPENATCPECHGTLRELPPEITEQLIVVPARYEVVQHVRHKAVCRCCEAFTAAPMPKPMIEGSSYGSASFLAYIACNKYQLGLPYYRQEKLFDQSGVPLNRTTMANLMNTCADRTAALFELLKIALLSQSILHADETTVQVLKEPGREAQTKSFMWLYCSAVGATHPVILFDYRETRAGEHPRTFLSGFSGYLQVDGYAGYNGVKGVIWLGCMAHVRRGFVKAQDAIPEAQRAQALAAWPIAQIAMLYKIEKQCADVTPAQRKAARQQYSLPIMNVLKAWLDRHQAQAIPKSLLGKAIHYALGQWERLLVYLGDGRLSIDNNIAERAIKDLVLGRKAWLFADRPEGANTIAVMHSLVQTAVANGLDPFQYLRHVFTVMPTLKTSKALEQLLPWNVVLQDRGAPVEVAA